MQTTVKDLYNKNWVVDYHISDIKLAAWLETLVRNDQPYAPFGRSVHAGALKVCAEKSQFFAVLLVQNSFVVLVIQQLTYEHNLILLLRPHINEHLATVDNNK